VIVCIKELLDFYILLSFLSVHHMYIGLMVYMSWVLVLARLLCILELGNLLVPVWLCHQIVSVRRRWLYVSGKAL